MYVFTCPATELQLAHLLHQLVSYSERVLVLPRLNKLELGSVIFGDDRSRALLAYGYTTNVGGGARLLSFHVS